LRFLRAELPGIFATRSDALSPRMLRILEDLSADWRRLISRSTPSGGAPLATCEEAAIMLRAFCRNCSSAL
jgi:hypothetical protein